MKRRALSTSLWRIWLATTLLLKGKPKGIWRMRTNTMAIQEYRPHPPVQSLTINLHVAESPQTRILQIHLQSLPNYPWCPQNYLLHWLLRSYYHLLRTPPTLSSRTLLPPSDHDHTQIGEKLQIGGCIALRNTLVNCLLSLVTGDTPTKRWCYPDLFLSCTQCLQ